MATKVNFTFKKHKRGVWDMGDYIDIKLKKKKVGSILYHGSSGTYEIMLHIKREPTKEDPAPFINITLKKRFEKSEQACIFLNENIDAIQSKYNLYSQED